MPIPTYLPREVALKALDGLLGQAVPGLAIGRAISASAAIDKSKALFMVASRFYNPVDVNKTFGEVDTVCDAIVYAGQKKGTKGTRQGVVASAEVTAGIAGGLIVGAAGSVVVPVAGTIAGATIGAAVGKASVGVGYQILRKSKWLYKKIRKTQGVHRNEAAELLYYAATQADAGRDQLASTAALLLLLGSEYDKVMATPEDDAIARIAARMKSV